MRAIQFWILMLLAGFTCFFNVREIFLTRDIDQQQRVVVDSQETLSEGTAYENAWKQVAMTMYANGKNDPEILDILKRERIDVRANAPAAAGSMVPGTTPAPPSVPLKAPVTPPHTGN